MAALVSENFTVHKGNDFIIQFTIEDIVSLEGYNLRWVLCPEHPDETPNSPILLDKTNQGESPQIYTEANVVFIVVPSSDSSQASGINAGSYYHELHGLDQNLKGGVLGSGSGTFLNTRIGR